jgi:putative toxin-antitoxin system antitoxin component (TIGR02293 family)
MLTNYDAKAVAEIMGLAFVGGSGGGLSSASVSKQKRSRNKLAGALDQDFVIRVDDAFMYLVEIKNDTLAPFHASGTFDRHLADVLSHSVLSPSPIFIEKAVEKGLPREVLRHVAERLSGGDKAKIAALEQGVVPKTTLGRRETKLSPEESERTERVARLFVHARRALGTEPEAREFMTTPHPELDGRTPLDATKTDLGTRRTEQLLNALEYGLAL